MYKEDTNVFAYYIIVAILMANFNNFILWCIDNNTNLFNFKKDESSVDNFVMFISDNYKGYWIVNSKNFYLKEIFYENTKLFNFKNTIKDREDAVPYKLIKESGNATNRVLLQFTTTTKNKILLKSFKKYNEFYNYDLNVFTNGKFKDQVIFNAFSVFEMDLLE